MATARRQSSASSLGRYARQADAELELENRSLDFCNAFWGLNDPGVEVLFARMRYAAKTIEDLRAFWRERASIEDEYAKRLVKLSKSALGKDEIGELRASLETLRVETERQAGQHLQLSIAIRKDLETPTAEFAAKQAHHKKTFQANVEKTFKSKQAQETYVAKAKERYEQDCHRVNSYTAQQTLVQGKELERIMFKLDRAQSTVHANERDYANYTKVLADTVQKWDVEWKNFCDQCQDMEEERVEFMKDNVWAYANAVSTVCVAEDDSCEKIRLVLEQLEVEKDLQLFVSQYGTGSNIPDPPPFINHTIADVNTPKPATRPANFVRSSTRQSLMAQVMGQSQSQEEDPNDSGNAGVGSGAQRSQSRTSTHSRRGNMNGASSVSAAPPTSQYYSTNGPTQAKHQYNPSAGSSSQSVPPSSVPNGQYRSDSTAGQPTYGHSSSDHSKGVQSIGGPGDPLAAQLEVLRTGGGGSGSVRRSATAKIPPETHKPPLLAQGSVNRPASPGTLSPPPGSAPPMKPMNYAASAEAIVGAHPSTSRPSSPVPPHPAMMKRNSMARSTSPLPVEEVVSQYHQALPGERRLSRGNSANSQQQHRGRQEERALRATSPGPSGSGGFAGVGAQGRSPSPAFRRGTSPSRAPSPGLQGPPTVAVPRAASPLGIALDATGNVAHDSMADAYNARQQGGYAGGAPSPHQQPPVVSSLNQQSYGTPQQTGRPGYYGAAPPAPAPPPTTQPPPPPVGAFSQPGYPPAQAPMQHPYQAAPSVAPVYQQSANGYGAPPPHNGYVPQSQSVQSLNQRGGYPQQYQTPPSAPPVPGATAPIQRGSQQPPPQMQAPMQNPGQSPSPQPTSQPPTRAWIDNQPVLFYVKALYDYTATIDEEFDFQVGDVIAVTATPEDGWWSGVLLDDSRRVPGRSVFPSNFVCLF